MLEFEPVEDAANFVGSGGTLSPPSQFKGGLQRARLNQHGSKVGGPPKDEVAFGALMAQPSIDSSLVTGLGMLAKGSVIYVFMRK